MIWKHVARLYNFTKGAISTDKLGNGKAKGGDMTDNPTRTAVQSSLVDSWWDDAEAGECLPDGSETVGSGTSVSETVEDRYSETITAKPSPYSLGEFYKTTVSTFWERDALGVRAFGHDAIGAILGKPVAFSVDQAVDTVIRNPGDALASAAESLLPGSGALVTEAEESVMTATDVLIAGAMDFFSAPEAPSLGDYYARSVAVPALSLTSESSSFEGFGFDSETWRSTYPRAFSYPYSFYSEVSMADSLRSAASAAPVVEAASRPTPVTTQAVAVKKADSITVVAELPRRSYDFYPAPGAFESSYSIPFSAGSAVSETIMGPTPATSPKAESTRTLVPSTENLVAPLSSPSLIVHSAVIVESTPAISHRLRETAYPASSSPAQVILVDDSSPQDLGEVMVQGIEFLVARNVGGEVQAIESGFELMAMKPDAVPAMSRSVPAGYAAEFDSGPVPFPASREGVEAPVISVAFAGGDRVSTESRENATSSVSTKRRLSSTASDRGDFVAWSFVLGFAHGFERIFSPDPSAPMLAREGERFINAAAWFLPRKFAERVSERDCATEQADVIEGMSRRHESVANLDDMGSDRDGSQHKPDWSQLLREQAGSSRLKTFRPESAEDGDFDGDDSAFRPARDAFVM